jgi:hypothetical protein
MVWLWLVAVLGSVPVNKKQRRLAGRKAWVGAALWLFRLAFVNKST